MSKNCKCGSSNDTSQATIDASKSPAGTPPSNGKEERTSLYKVIMSCMTELNERDHFYQFPMSYGYQ